MSKSYYMHTINGKPACFDGWQVCIGINGHTVASTLRQIRHEQKLSENNRANAGYATLDVELGYVRFRCPTNQ